MTAETAARYTIRYRFDREHHALLVEDPDGEGYIVGLEGLECRLSGPYRLPDLEPTLRDLGWVPVPEVSPYRLDELQRLLCPTAA
jgi:hypothetical protein